MMRKSLFVLSLCMATFVAPVTQAASDSSDGKPVELKATIASGDAAAGKDKSVVCAGCHGLEGVTADKTIPNLAGQGASYVYKQLVEFKSGVRENAIMAGMVAALSDDDMKNLAAFYAELPQAEGISASENLEAGRQIYAGGITAIQVPACASCHAPDGAGNDAAKFPALSGQNAEYIVSSLESFRSGARANDPGNMMQMAAKRLSDAEIAAVANYVQGLH